jgi:hypothetical protein
MAVVLVQIDRVLEKTGLVALEDLVQDREITLAIIYINRLRLETPESGLVFKITGPETRMPVIPSPLQVTDSQVLVQAIMPGLVQTRV